MATIGFRCIDETNEVSPSDSPYFLVYVADIDGQRSDVQLVRRPSWDDEIDEGDARETTVNFAIDGIGVALVALLEEDWDNDFTPAKVNTIRSRMHSFNSLLQPFLIDEHFDEIKDAFRIMVNNRTVNDDVIAIRQMSPDGSLIFSDGKARYRVHLDA